MFILTAFPKNEAVYEAVKVAIGKIARNEFRPGNTSERLKVYSWDSVSARTEKVYRECMAEQESSFVDRIYRFFGCGSALSGSIGLAVATMSTMALRVIEWFEPESSIEKVPHWSKYATMPKSESYNIQSGIRA